MNKYLLSCAGAMALALGPIAVAQPLVNLGLVGVGRLPADSFDALGPNVDTLGGFFSGLYLNPANVSQSGGSEILALSDTFRRRPAVSRSSMRSISRRALNGFRWRQNRLT